MKEEPIQRLGPMHLEYPVRFGVVANCAPLIQAEESSCSIPCPNAKCISGGFRIKSDAVGIQSGRCKGYIKLPGNMAQFCNFHIRYRVRRNTD